MSPRQEERELRSLGVGLTKWHWDKDFLWLSLHCAAGGHLGWPVTAPSPPCVCVVFAGQECATTNPAGSGESGFGSSLHPEKVTGEKSHRFLSPSASDRHVWELDALLRLITQSSSQTK